MTTSQIQKNAASLAKAVASRNAVGDDNSLRSLQESLLSHLQLENPAIMQQVVGTDREMVEERLNVYGHGYYLRILEAMHAGYVYFAKYIGEEAFDEIGQAYIDAYPSRYFSVDLVGQHFPDFLATTQPYAKQPYLSELARFCWALNCTVDAADGPLLQQADIMAIPQENWADMRFSFHPSLELLAFHWNVVPIWSAMVQDAVAPEPAKQQELSSFVVWRKQNQSFYCPLTHQEAWVLKAIQNNQSFGEICDGLLQWFPEDQVASYTVGLLLRWLKDEMFSTVQA